MSMTWCTVTLAFDNVVIVTNGWFLIGCQIAERTKQFVWCEWKLLPKIYGSLASLSRQLQSVLMYQQQRLVHIAQSYSDTVYESIDTIHMVSPCTKV